MEYKLREHQRLIAVGDVAKGDGNVNQRAGKATRDEWKCAERARIVQIGQKQGGLVSSQAANDQQWSDRGVR